MIISSVPDISERSVLEMFRSVVRTRPLKDDLDKPGLMIRSTVTVHDQR